MLRNFLYILVDVNFYKSITFYLVLDEIRKRVNNIVLLLLILCLFGICFNKRRKFLIYNVGYLNYFLF